MTSARGPNISPTPSLRSRILSTTPMVLGRWEMITTVVPRCLSCMMQSVSAASPSASRFELGSSRTTRLGLPKHRARKANALPIATGENGTALPHLGVVTIGQSHDHIVHTGHLRRQDRFRILSLLESSDIGRDGIGEQFDVLGQIAEMPTE